MIQVRLDGHHFDLDDIAGAFPDGSPSVARDPDGTYWLQTREFDPSSLPDGEAVLREAQDIVDRMVGWVRMQGGSTRSVRVGRGFRGVPDASGRSWQSIVVGTAEARGRAYNVTIADEIRGRHKVSASGCARLQILRLLSSP